MKPNLFFSIAAFGVAAVALSVIAAPAWGQVDANVACSEQRFEDTRFLVCPYDSRSETLRLADRDTRSDTLRSFDALAALLGDDARYVRFAMNAGMFNASGGPIGLYVERGVTRHRLNRADGPGNFHLKPNGVFWQSVNGEVHVTETDTYAAFGARPLWATQSGPMLVINGAIHPRFSPDGASHYIRNGVGVGDAHTAYFVISREAVSFGRLARFFRDGLHCNDALFLDGHISSLWAPLLNRRDNDFPLGPMLVVLNRKQTP